MRFKQLIGCVLVLLAFGRVSSAFTLRFYLDIQNNGTWNLYGSTDAPGGIAAAVVNLKNVTTGTSVAPRAGFGNTVFTGFDVGNIFQERQAFAGQNPTGEDSVVYGIGYTPVPDSSFMRPPFPLQITGTASSLPVRLYTGTWNQSGPMPEIDFVDAPTAAVFKTVGTSEVPAAAVIPEIRLPQFTLGPQPPPGDFDWDYAVSGSDFVIWQSNFPKASGATIFTGDADHDGDVDGADFVAWQTKFPQGTPNPGGGFIIPPWNAPQGDFDADGDVDGADFVVWQTHFPSSGIPLGPDVDGDGDTDGKEYVAWLVSQPYVPPPGGPVPEPAAGWLIGCAVLGVVGARRARLANRKRRN
jgi:hypothetical protein